MARFTLHIAACSLLSMAMLMTYSSAMAQSRGGRGDNRERRSAFTENRGSSRDNSRQRDFSRRSDARSSNSSASGPRQEVSNWPKSSNSGSTSINSSRDRSNSDARRNNMRHSFGEKQQITDDSRPGNNNRPGGNFGSDRPGNSNRPGGNFSNGPRPGKDNRPGGNFSNGPRPGGRPVPPPPSHGVITHRPGSWRTPVAPPMRTFRPVHHHIFRPVPPPNFRPWHKAPIITGILGLSFGAAYYTSLDYLFTRGYEIDGYYDGIVYLRNIQELGCFWPDVMLNYGSRQALSSAEFHYSTSYDDLGRFNRLYSDLCSRYGQPVTYRADDDGIRSTWYGGNARGFVSLEYFYSNSRFYTTLSYGN